ncbi:Dabb family protein [Thiofilum flexile]|uniref:Dabb family protein n=1 Tax=Thiofilum flexile TaxID=125627 RepID=UPI00037A9AF3|nr:Dabb family protein [Thiofilum flexile]
MFKHCVFVKFNPSVSETERQKIYSQLEALREQLSGWLGFVAGANITTEVGMDKGYNGGFIIDFADEAALQAYQDNATHKQIAAQLVAAAQGGVEGIMVFDMHLA